MDAHEKFIHALDRFLRTREWPQASLTESKYREIQIVCLFNPADIKPPYIVQVGDRGTAPFDGTHIQAKK